MSSRSPQSVAERGGPQRHEEPETKLALKPPLADAPTRTPKPKQPKAKVPQTASKPAARTVREAAEKEGWADATDAVSKNGAIFESWPKPKLALVLTGEQMGYIEPCGCAGLTNQKGGLRRRHTLLKKLASEGWPTVALDVGGLIQRFGRQTVIKYQTTVDALKTMDYAAVGFGRDDLKLPAGELLSAALNVNIFVAANLKVLDFEIARFRVIEAGGMKVGVTAIVGDTFQEQLNNPEIQFTPARQGLAEVLPELKAQKCDLLVLLSHATPKESRELAGQFADFDVVVTVGGADEPPHQATRQGSGTVLVEVGHKGMYAVVLGLYDDKKQPLRYQRVPLDARFKDSPQMDQLLVSYQDQLQQLGWSGLGLTPAAHSRGKFAGSQACRDCHATEFSIWEDTPHSHATDTLEHLSPPRQYDPECVSCHSTGWNPQEYFPYATGFDSVKATPLLVGNGCENCHGPGAAHVAAENGGDSRLQSRLRGEMRLTLNKETRETIIQGCMECHDLDNSPDFSFDAYWPQIEH
ncbi:MAG: multiheme c-type cytochrome [Pirellulales bacterium]